MKFNCLLRETLNAFSYKMAVKLILPGFYFRRLFFEKFILLYVCIAVVVFTDYYFLPLFNVSFDYHWNKGSVFISKFLFLLYLMWKRVFH